jgi:hypothetical protein
MSKRKILWIVKTVEPMKDYEGSACSKETYGVYDSKERAVQACEKIVLLGVDKRSLYIAPLVLNEIIGCERFRWIGGEFPLYEGKWTSEEIKIKYPQSHKYMKSLPAYPIFTPEEIKEHNIAGIWRE